MVLERKSETNRRNSKLSTGPKNTNKTRLNALKHGLLSREALITDGDGREDKEAFEELSSEFQRDLAPAGPLEEFLVDQIIMFAWRWRRVPRFETAAIHEESRKANDRWETTVAISPFLGLSVASRELPELLEAMREHLKKNK